MMCRKVLICRDSSLLLPYIYICIIVPRLWHQTTAIAMRYQVNARRGKNYGITNLPFRYLRPVGLTADYDDATKLEDYADTTYDLYIRHRGIDLFSSALGFNRQVGFALLLTGALPLYRCRDYIVSVEYTICVYPWFLQFIMLYSSVRIVCTNVCKIVGLNCRHWYNVHRRIGGT